MIGQQRLLNKINSYTIDNFPKTLLLVGEAGCGKRTLVKYIEDNIIKLGSHIDITENLSDELFLELYRKATPGVYLADLTQCTEKQQNTLLKIAEEPPSNSFIILIAENTNNILNTLLARCTQLIFEPYSKEELLYFVEDKNDVNLDKMLSILKTPGKLIATNKNSFNGMLRDCNNLLVDLPTINFYELLSLSTKINFKDQYDKYDCIIFLDLLENLMYNRILTYNDTNTLALYKLLKTRKKALVDPRVNRELFFENLLIGLWRTAQDGYKGTQKQYN